MEKVSLIKPKEFTKGYIMEVNFGMYFSERTFRATTKKELYTQIKDSGWRNLDSDEFGCIGYWCGCDYKD